LRSSSSSPRGRGWSRWNSSPLQERRFWCYHSLSRRTCRHSPNPQTDHHSTGSTSYILSDASRLSTPLPCACYTYAPSRTETPWLPDYIWHLCPDAPHTAWTPPASCIHRYNCGRFGRTWYSRCCPRHAMDIASHFVFQPCIPGQRNSLTDDIHWRFPLQWLQPQVGSRPYRPVFRRQVFRTSQGSQEACPGSPATAAQFM
jgi:hypothetical protein